MEGEISPDRDTGVMTMGLQKGRKAGEDSSQDYDDAEITLSN